jgi:hypothetical protein
VTVEPPILSAEGLVTFERLRRKYAPTIYGRMDDRGRFTRTHPRWMKLRAVLGALVPHTGPVVTAIDRERGVITIGRRP